MKPLSIALVGAAGKVAAPCHLNALDAADNLQLTALCDTNEAAIKKLGSRLGIPKVYSQFEQVLEDPSIDAVDIIVPPFLHAPLAIAAAKAGKHVYVEKPMAHSLGEANEMVATAKKANVQLMVGESYYFHGPHQLAHQLIQAGEIGEIVQVRETKAPWVFTDAENRRLNGQGHNVPWRFDPQLSGGGDFPWTFDHGPHLFATARLFGTQNIDRVMALPRQRGYAPEEHRRGIASISWLYEGGDIDGSWLHAEHAPNATPWIGFRTEILGTSGSIRAFGEGGGAAPGYDQVAPVTLFKQGKARDFDLNEGPDRSWYSNNSYYDQAHTTSLSHFAHSILHQTRLRYDGHDGAQDLAATLATIKSAIEGRWVALTDIPEHWTAYG
ncbi:MAG: Gfo/Idh/MocA family oxidoreductase [Pirellulaceae bacterium]|nr:Gfo/Idh/MocA family oxidoreductase [Pirellulaceae bacterium]